ncbi:MULTISPECIES: hypothetical protein [unclassified Paraburkholderia]|nr:MULTISPECIES: hypothetical protein [unclassified Paraburkholderia]
MSALRTPLVPRAQAWWRVGRMKAARARIQDFLNEKSADPSLKLGAARI